jgi:N-acetylglutamate synthase-like GNAT family acetyltransferase
VITIRTQLDPTMLDQVVDFHLTHIAKAYRLGESFETHLREGLSGFISNYHAAKECFWLAESEGQVVGTVAVVAEDEAVARVRFLLAHPDFREDLEKELLERAVTFCEEKYSKVYLLAAKLFERLAPLAKAAGFQKVHERPVVLWGRSVTDERYELELPKRRM